MTLDDIFFYFEYSWREIGNTEIRYYIWLCIQNPYVENPKSFYHIDNGLDDGPSVNDIGSAFTQSSMT